MTVRSDVAAAVVEAVDDGAVLYLGGAVLRRKPMAAVRALIDSGRKGLHLVTFAGSLGVDLLVSAGFVSSVTAAYVGLGPHGFAPAYSRAVTEGAIDDREHTEWTLLGQLRAAATGLPFLPTRAGRGSAVVDRLDLPEVVDPHTGEPYLALPPLHPDVALLHAWRATERGDVQFPWPPEHLWDVDVLAARASNRTVVTVEEIVDTDVATAEPALTRMFPFDVDDVVLARRGSWPTACPPAVEEDSDAVRRYASSDGDLSLLDPVGA